HRTRQQWPGESEPRPELHRVRADGGNYQRDEPCTQGPLQRTAVDSAWRPMGSQLLGQAIGILNNRPRKSVGPLVSLFSFLFRIHARENSLDLFQCQTIRPV